MDRIPRVILLIETSRAFGRGLLYGIARYSRLHGPWAFYREPRGLETHIPRLKNWGADGIIMRDSAANKELLELELPTITVIHGSTVQTRLPSVITDSKKISQLAVEHLLERGFRSFAFCGFKGSYWSDEREKYFMDILSDAGYQPSIYKQPQPKKIETWLSEQRRIASWLSSLPKPLGVMACNDDRGHHVLEACKVARLRVPEEVAVVGADDDALICDLCDPPLTSVVLDTEKAGFAAAELLDRLMNGESLRGQRIVVNPSFVRGRQSTDITAINDAEVVKAIHFIRKNARNRINVDEVVKSTSLGRRSLETRFKRALNRSIQQEIRRKRAELIEQMLVETDMTISEIVEQYDFSDAEHIARYFRKERGVGLRDFRRIHSTR